MKIDQSNRPTEVWQVNRERIRKGLAVQRLEPLENSWWHSIAKDYSTFKVHGRAGRYYSTECYPSFAEAHAVGTNILRILLRDETRRHNSLMQHLKAAQAALHELQGEME